MMNSITVIKDDGQKQELEIIDTLKINATEYVIVSEKSSDNAYAYKVVGATRGEKEYASVGNGKEFNMVLQKYNELHPD